jgi:hypothetical protein
MLESRLSLLELRMVGRLSPEKTLDGVSGKSGRANETPLEGVPFREDI